MDGKWVHFDIIIPFFVNRKMDGISMSLLLLSGGKNVMTLMP